MFSLALASGRSSGVNIVRVGWAGKTVLLRDPVERGEFVCGIECNDHGIGVRHEGCSEAAELRIEKSRITSIRRIA
jgi:hypothetical protein